MAADGRRAAGGGRDAHGNGAAGAPDDHALEALVDVHAFTPGELERHASAAGFADVRVRGEELLANWFGWFNRTVEATARARRHPARLVPATPTAATSRCRRSTARCWSRACPAAGFYNLMLTARKPPA